MVHAGQINRRAKALLLISAALLIVSATNDWTPQEKLVRAARVLTMVPTVYDGHYRNIAYPGGDPGGRVGVCTDLVIRSYRAIGIDLQVLIHEDMESDFYAYPVSKLYEQLSPDPNIDHRRVPNLKVFLDRHAQILTTSIEADKLGEWMPGDIVVFDLVGNGIPSHVGIIADDISESGLPMVFHHFPPYPSEEDCLARWPIAGHYRYFPEKSDMQAQR